MLPATNTASKRASTPPLIVLIEHDGVGRIDQQLQDHHFERQPKKRELRVHGGDCNEISSCTNENLLNNGLSAASSSPLELATSASVTLASGITSVAMVLKPPAADLVYSSFELSRM